MTAHIPYSANLLPSRSHLGKEWDTYDEQVCWDTAITLGEMSSLAYTVEHNRMLVLRLLGFEDIILLDAGPRSGFLAMTDDTVVIAFRGTDDLEDWLGNLNFRNRSRDDEGREFHKEFWSSYDCFAHQIKTKLVSRQSARVWITGHSLGGAMAACCAFDLVQSKVPFAGLVTFGQPRIGNRGLAHFLDGEIGHRCMRFINETDVVPLAPPGIGITLPDYWHFGSRIKFNNGQMERRYGPTIFSARPSEAEAGSSEAAEEVGKDGEESLTEEEFAVLQKQLMQRKLKQPEDDVDEPSELTGEATSAPIGIELNSGFGGWIDRLTDSIEKRIHDHSMVQYLRQLNKRRSNEING